MLGLTLGSLVALVLAFPVSESSRNQIIGLIGLLLSGIIAFSSSTIFANLMAGIMLRVTRPFGTGSPPARMHNHRKPSALSGRQRQVRQTP